MSDFVAYFLKSRTKNALESTTFSGARLDYEIQKTHRKRTENALRNRTCKCPLQMTPVTLKFFTDHLLIFGEIG